jgi:hypothetical protein
MALAVSAAERKAISLLTILFFLLGKDGHWLDMSEIELGKARKLLHQALEAICYLSHLVFGNVDVYQAS